MTQPKSIAWRRLSSRDPRAMPHIHYNFFDDENDLDRMVEAVRLSRKIGRTAPFSDLIDSEIAHGKTVLTPAEVWGAKIYSNGWKKEDSPLNHDIPVLASRRSVLIAGASIAAAASLPAMTVTAATQ